MKTKLIYILIGLMVISLLGIIVLQTNWVSSAIVEREKEFDNRVNSALNEVNDIIGENEATTFIREEFGGMDSLMHNFLVIKDEVDSLGENITIETHDSESFQITLDNDGETREIIREFHGRPERVMRRTHHSPEEIEVMIHQEGDEQSTVIDLSEFEENKFDHIRSAVKRYTFEKWHSQNLHDRISMSSIEKTVKKALSKEGIVAQVEIGVINRSNSEAESGFTTKNFAVDQRENVYTKNLFPNDGRMSSPYELNLQFGGSEEFVWSGIRSMVLLSVLFTILILLCFGYSLYFIFKQKRISQIKNDFINNMTHELKTPLASISLAASSIAHPKVIEDPSEVSRFIEVIKSEEQRINAHVERVLDIAALDSKDLKMNLSEVELLDLLQQSCSNVQLSLDAVDGVLNLETNLTTALINGDEFHLVNVFTNILDNSIKYCKEDLQITLKISEADTTYSISIEDNGIGMRKKSQKLAFDKFYREETGNIHTRKGFGLGLSYVKSIIEAHFGSVTLSSELNVGTTILITLPKK